ncbi:MAG: hypothetical protein JRF32_08195 [Deltaproteobacteria bacterium]|nr:hypothetical protein [Deltaproteobacteria bacterium]MBW2177753.1 hypothetical protein [Deltaproteobacteria bacterium]MBW2297573.1 hypothetical protein [Deltaproteobacteria bacterium]MBW2611246.1 hypothetical protein [Deltaproteobacteria bacterium]
MLGFIKQQERKVALRLLAWQYQRQNIPLPTMAAMDQQAKRLVDEAHRIARERGRNVITIIKELVADIGGKDTKS